MHLKLISVLFLRFDNYNYATTALAVCYWPFRSYRSFNRRYCQAGADFHEVNGPDGALLAFCIMP